jgi:hypothetical protein
MEASANFAMTQIGEYQLRVSREIPSAANPESEVTIYSNVVKIRIEAPQEDKLLSRTMQQNGEYSIRVLAVLLHCFLLTITSLWLHSAARFATGRCRAVSCPGRASRAF